MDFIQTSNKQLDKFGTGKHGFSAGNPTLGVLATYLSNIWCDGVQQEIINVIEAAGLTPTSADLTQLRQALSALFLKRDGSLPMLGALQAKQGAISANNPNNVGYTFNVDFDSGMFSPTDGVLQLATNGIVFMQNSANGYCQFLKGVRAPKGGPGGNDASNVSGFSFQEDGDTGMFAVGGNNAAGSDLVFYIDNVEAGRIKASMRGGTSNGWGRTINGTILQWGQINQSDNGSAVPFTITLPTTFPSSAFQAFIMPGTGISGAGPSMGTVEGQSTTQLTGFTLGPSATRVWRWLAIGV